ncbi:MAG: hypothetical protein HQL50_01920 [Magnetococcales bacterium]|nr:hypothetical protein [Magnetococcales bacterium]
MWWPASSRFEMMVGALLVQNTTWRQASQVIDRLRDHSLLDPVTFSTVPISRMQELLKPAGFFRVKSQRLRNLLALLERYDYDLDRLFSQKAPELRKTLLAVNGIGKETADSIVCYGAGYPVFVVDAYARRLAKRLQWQHHDAEYDLLRKSVEQSFNGVMEQLGELHGLIVVHCKEVCRKKPLCVQCVLKQPPLNCPFPRGESL